VPGHAGSIDPPIVAVTHTASCAGERYSPSEVVERREAELRGPVARVLGRSRPQLVRAARHGARARRRPV